MNRFALLIVIGCGAWTQSGCKAVAKVLGKATAEVTEKISEEGGLALGGDSQSLNSYVEGYNLLLGRPQDSMERYMKSVPEAGPPSNKKPRLNLMENLASRDLETARAAFEKGKSSADSETKAMTGAADEALKNATNIITALTAMNKYYSAEDFKDDAGAKAQELHGTFLSEFPKYKKNLAVLEQALEKVETKRTEKELAGLDDKESPGYLYRKFNLEAKRLLSQQDAAAFSKQFTEVDRLYNLVETVAKTDAAGAYKAAFDSYAKIAGQFHSEAKKINRDLSSGKSKTGKAGPSREDLVTRYNSCVSIANSLRQTTL